MFRRVRILSVLATLALAAPVLADGIQDGGFEAYPVATAPGVYSGDGYVYPGGTLGSWTYGGDAGLVDAMSPVFFGGAPRQGYEGAQFAFIRGDTGFVSQTFFTSSERLFSLSWREGSRPKMGDAEGEQSYDVLLDGIALASFATPTGQDFLQRSVTGPLLAAGTDHILTFQGTNLDGDDNTAFIDAVALAAAPVPEPGEWALMLAGLAVVGWTARRRKA